MFPIKGDYEVPAKSRRGRLVSEQHLEYFTSSQLKGIPLMMLFSPKLQKMPG